MQDLYHETQYNITEKHEGLFDTFGCVSVNTRIPRAPCDVTTHVQDLFRWAMQTPVFTLTKNREKN